MSSLYDDEVVNENDERTPLLREASSLQNTNTETAPLRESGDGESKPEAEAKKPATFAELFSMATGLDGLLMFLGFLAAMADGCSWPLLFMVFGDMTNSFINYNSTMNFTINGTTSPMDAFEDTMTDYSLRYVYIGIGVYAVTYFHIALLQLSGERQTFRLRKTFFKALLRQNIGWYDSQQSGELTTRLADDLERVKEGVGDKLGFSLQFMAQFIAGFAFGFAKGWKLTLVIMSMTPLLAFFASLLGKIMTSYSALEQAMYAKAGAIAEEVLSCIRTVISFNGHPKEISRYSAALEESQRLGIKKNVITGLSVGTTMLIMFGAYGLAFWYGSTQVNEYNKSGGQDGLSPGGVFSVFFSVMIGSFALGSAAPHITAVLTAKGSAGTVHSIIKNEPSIDSSESGGKRPQSVTGDIQFRDVAFSYPTRKEVQVLKSFDLTIKAGQTVALVGSSGCGKSTIINLLQRFYDPDQGNIILDGEDLCEFNIHWLRNNIGVVSQEPILFGMTIKENIILGRPGVSEQEILQAAKMANAHDFIVSLPNGYDTLVGERGAQLSGGQKQRVAIARALVRDPKILLLDEATSALDSEAEGIVQAALDKAREGRTTVVVAHRLSTIQNADLIYVLENGQIVESGMHHDLMEHKGAYYHLVMLQTIAEENDDQQEFVGEKANSAPGRKQSMKANTQRQFSNQSKDDGSQPKKLNLFKATSKQVEEKDEDKDIPRPGFVRMFKSNMQEWPYILFGCVGAFANGAVFPVFAVFFSEVFKTFTKTGQELLDQGLLWAMMYVALGGLSFIANLIQSSSFGVSGERLTTRLRAKTFTNILRQDVEYFDDAKHSTGALTTRLATDASMVRSATGIRLAVIVQSATSMVAGITIAFIFGWKLALLIVGMSPIMVLSGVLNMAIMKGNQKRDTKLLEGAGKTASECIENIRTVQSLAREPYFYEKYCEQLVKPHKENMKQAHIYGLCYGFSQSFIFFMYASAFRFGAYLVAHDGMDPDLVFRVFFAIAFSGRSVGQAASFLPDYSKAQLSAGHIFTMLDLVPKIDVYSTSGKAKPTKTVNVDLHNIQFSYPSRPEVTVLRGIDISIKAGQTVALVGQSGCGKSTIVSLLQRYYDPDQGSIVIEGMDIKEYNVRSLRSLISVVSQEPVLFNCTIRDNIAYGLETEVPVADVIAAARTANAHDFISEMPQGYDTMVGEKGTQLSGGQKQRVAIARALIRNPKILLLDEATSALDTHSEKVVQAALDKAREGRTCILIAHRLSTIQNADVIYAMEDGRVMEFGSHQELLAKRGVYFTLVQGQQFNKTE